MTGKKANNGWTVSFSHIRNKKLQGVNLQYKRVYWPEKQRYIRLRISTKALKTINKLGLEVMAERAGLDPESLPYTDADPARKEWLVENAGAHEEEQARRGRARRSCTSPSGRKRVWPSRGTRRRKPRRSRSAGAWRWREKRALDERRAARDVFAFAAHSLDGARLHETRAAAAADGGRTREPYVVEARRIPFFSRRV